MSAFIDNNDFRKILKTWRESAIILLYNNFYDRLILVADMYTRDRHVSEDVVQEVLVDVWKRHEEISQMQDEPIERYLIKAVQNHSITHYKRLVKKSEGETQYFYFNSQYSSEYPAESEMVSDERRRILRLVLATLPPRERECFMMQAHQGMRVKDIARRLGITVKAVERNLTSARKRLRRFGNHEYFSNL